ncbi:MAG: hypothetical protein M3458_20150 [Acidobacteriota bacterium]|nr:hypothetical protein [Acidobacteriota bacterium]
MTHLLYHLRICCAASLVLAGVLMLGISAVTAVDAATLIVTRPQRTRGDDVTRRARPGIRQSKSAPKSNAKLHRRREQALNTLIEIASDARKFENQLYSARVQSLCADALWSFNESAARSIFLRAWESATPGDATHTVDSSTIKDKSLPIRSQTNTRMTEARQEVLAKVAARDSRLAEKFLREVVEEEKKLAQFDDKVERLSSGTLRGSRMSSSNERRLQLAEILLGRGERGPAAKMTAPLIREGVSVELIAFLLRFREHDAAQADAMFLRTIHTTGANGADANSVLLLSTYVISPRVLVVVTEGSTNYRALPSPTNATPVALNVRAAFYDFAARALVARTRAAMSDPHETSALFFANARLLPFFEREAPPHHVAALRACQAALAGQLEESRREALMRQSEVTSVTSKNPTDTLRPLLDGLEREQNKSKHDAMRLAIISTAARHKLWARARDVVAEIEDVDTRREALLLIAIRQIENLSRSYAEETHNDYERAATFVRNADVPPLARAWGLVQAAELAERRGRKEHAVELLNEAISHAANITNNTHGRVAAFVAAAKVVARLEPARAWEMLASVVQSANAVADLTGDETMLELLPGQAELEWPVDVASGEASIESVSDEASFDDEVDSTIDATPFRLDELFAAMARLDFEQALAAARTLNGQVPRALASIAAARVALDANDQPPMRKAKAVD